MKTKLLFCTLFLMLLFVKNNYATFKISNSNTCIENIDNKSIKNKFIDNILNSKIVKNIAASNKLNNKVYLFLKKETDNRRTNTLVTIGFVCGLIGLFIGGIPLGIAAIVCSIIGSFQINKTKEKGKGFGGVGIVLGIIDLFFTLVYLSK